MVVAAGNTTSKAERTERLPDKSEKREWRRTQRAIEPLDEREFLDADVFTHKYSDSFGKKDSYQDLA